jgi:hypothetical protein
VNTDVTTDDIQITIYYTSLDADGAATAREVRSIFEAAGLRVRPGESLAEWRLDHGGESYRQAVGFGFGGPAHADLVVVVLDWLVHHLAQAGAGIFFTRFLAAAGKAAGADAWAVVKAGILALRQHHWRKRPPRAVWPLVPVPTPEGVRWVGFQLPPLMEDLTEPLAQLDDLVLPTPRPGHAVTWLEWDSDQLRWR